MKLLVVAQKLDRLDNNLGVFHQWCAEFSRHVERLVVIANAVGEINLPANVEVYSLGKEHGASRIKRYWKFWELFSFYYARTDAVFVHMVPEFVLASSPFLVSLRHPVGLWYVHRSATWKLKVAERLVDYIFTASELSFRVPSKKVIHTGHAIDVDYFRPLRDLRRPVAVRLLTLGRISPIKDYETMINACAVLKETWQRPFSLSIVGGPVADRDESYYRKLKKLVHEKRLAAEVAFFGPRPYTEVPEIYHDHDLFISMSRTGSVDKAVLEAMASGLTVLTANEAFQSVLPSRYFLERRTPQFLAERIKTFAGAPYPNTELREVVVSKHSLKNTITHIVSRLSEPSGFSPLL